ncbi:carboxypeptidase-like regulatory domain-containing protein [Gracilimonas sp. Q87]|uniref:carboxypeptidase-like regulatory domain-containing protein n=1 Tax=Gracilimonas sp. Q87 TaxID=3384766 RepID=UPI00398414F4
MKAVFIQVLLILFLVSCAKDNVGVDEYGGINGRVIDSETGDGIGSVNVTTTPPTVAILTENDGAFQIAEAPVGSYTVQARKPGYKNNSVSVSVGEWKSVRADLLLEAEEEDPPAEENVLRATVDSWFNAQSGDSSFVEVEYSVENISERTDVDEYEVYFEITTGGNTYYFDAAGTDLKVDQKNYGEFRKYIRSETASDVLIEKTWFSEGSGDDSGSN